MSQWTIAKRLTVGFCAVLAVTSALGLFTVLRFGDVNRLAGSIRNEATPGLVMFANLESLARENMALVLQTALSEDPARIAEIEKRIAEISASSDKFYSEYEPTMVQDEDKRLFKKVMDERARLRQIRKDFMTFAKANDATASGLEFDRSVRAPYTDYLNAIVATRQFNEKLSSDYATAIVDMVASARTLTMIGILAAIAIGAGVTFVIVRSTNRVLTSSVESLSVGSQQLVSAAGQVATSAQSLSQGATEQAASLEETSASMEEMASMTRQNAENSQSAASLMSDVDSQVQGSNQALNDMVTSMASIQESSRQVAKIIKTIDEIAFQTNILALNAAVEAARAGEAGMGFAVVADEVRNLAQRSAQAARDTATLIEESIEKAARGNVKVEQVATAIAGITDSVSKVKSLVDGVSIASRQQSQGIDQVSQAVSQMEKVTQTTAATAEESAAASEELNAQAEGVMDVVAQLRRLVTTAADAARATAAPAARPAARVLRMSSPAAVRAEDELPMESTGTFGKF